MDGAEPWSLSADGNELLNTTFGNYGGQDFCPSTTSPCAPKTGAVEQGTLGVAYYSLDDNSVYDFSFTFAHSAPTLTLDFLGAGMQGPGDEGWGLDNVSVRAAGVSAVPEPGTYALVATGLGALAFWRRRRTA